MEHSFPTTIDNFVDHMKSLRRILPLLTDLVHQARETAKEDFVEYAGEHDLLVEDEDEVTRYRVPLQKLSDFRNKEKPYRDFNVASRILPRSFIVTLISRFDAYLGDLIRAMFAEQPELLHASDRSLSYSQLTYFDGLDDAQEFLVEQEVESVLRDSHADHFDWLENKLDIPLRKDLESWPRFVEVTERRNLFVHADGRVSQQYIRVCEEEGVDLDDVEVGDELSVSPEYFNRASECMFEIGTKLGQVIWRKLCPEDLSEADKKLNNLSVDLLRQDDHSLALKLLTFATETLPEYSDEEAYLFFLVNQAQAYKWLDEEQNCASLLREIDWSAKGNHLKLAKSVLTDDYERAAELMKVIGTDGSVGRRGYRDWPLFREFRETEEFREAYEAVFEEEFEVSEEDIDQEIEETDEE